MKKWFALASLFVIVKFWNISLVPVFYDEAIYLSEAAKITQNVKNLFIAFEGVQFPVATWLLALVNVLTHSFLNLLVSGRVTMAAIDVLSSGFVFLIGKKIMNERFGAVAALIYLSLPLTFIHGRFVMLEPLTNLFSLATVYFVMTGSTGGIVLTSLLAFFTKPLAAQTLTAAFAWPLFASIEDRINPYKKILPAIVVVALIILAIFIPLSANFSRHVNVVPVSFSQAVASFYFNFRRILVWQINYLTWLGFLLTIVGIIFPLVKVRKQTLWLVFWIIVVVFVGAYFGKNLYPRHLYLLSAPIALLIASLLYNFGKRLAIIAFGAVLVILWQKNISFLNNPKGSLVGEDRQQFYEDWSSGVGLRQVANTLASLSIKRQIKVYIESDPITSWALPNLFVTGNTQFEVINDRTPETGSYVVLNRDLDLARNWQVARISAFPKTNQRSITIYKVL